MRALIQRVSRARVSVAGVTVGEIGVGLMILICAMEGDDEAKSTAMAAKIARLRIFKDDQGKMNRALVDTGGEALVVSQFTLAADTSRGNRPGFTSAAGPEVGARLYRHFSDALAGLGVRVANGQLGADMDVELVNDGPVTIWLDQ